MPPGELATLALARSFSMAEVLMLMSVSSSARITLMRPKVKTVILVPTPQLRGFIIVFMLF
jgi:hypothetical protein